MALTPHLRALIEALRVLPGVGPKSAQRMAFQLLTRQREQAGRLAGAITGALERVGQCRLCRNFSESELCSLCEQPRRQASGLLCVVESPADVMAIEQSGQFEGRYFVLMGRLSPLDGIGPEAIGLDLLEQRLAAEQPQEVIIATNPTVEGDATAHYIAELAREQGIAVSRLAQGIPSGGELEHLDSRTLASSLAGRRRITD